MKRYCYNYEKLKVKELPADSERKYPCSKCGKLRTKEEGGTTFTVCDECWGITYKKPKKEIEKLQFDDVDNQAMIQDLWLKQCELIDKINDETKTS